jgi:hypothetical protein
MKLTQDPQGAHVLSWPGSPYSFVERRAHFVMRLAGTQMGLTIETEGLDWVPPPNERCHFAVKASGGGEDEDTQLPGSWYTYPKLFRPMLVALGVDPKDDDAVARALWAEMVGAARQTLATEHLFVDAKTSFDTLPVLREEDLFDAESARRFLAETLGSDEQAEAAVREFLGLAEGSSADFDRLVARRAALHALCDCGPEGDVEPFILHIIEVRRSARAAA